MSLRHEYASLFPFLERVKDELSQRIEAMLSAGLISPASPVQARVKTWDSIAEKIARNSIDLSSVLKMPDLIGARIILQFRRDVEKVAQLFRAGFTLLEEQDKSTELLSSEFGYQSLHLSVRIPSEWISGDDMAQGELVVEIQIRTTAQHIWASASHFLQYKKETDVPAPIRRSIHRVSALLETVDLELERVLDERQGYRSALSVDDKERKLNVDLLESILIRSLPRDNKGSSEDYASLLADLAFFGIHTSGELERLLSARVSQVLVQDREDARKIEAMDKEAFEMVKERAVRGAMSTHTGLVRRSLRLEFPEKWEQLRKKKELPGMMAAMAVLLSKRKKE